MNDIGKHSILHVVDDDHYNSKLLAGVNRLLLAAEFIEKQDKLDNFNSKSDSSLILESTQTIVNESSEPRKQPDKIDPRTEISPEFTKDNYDYISQLYWNIPRNGPFICRVEGCLKEFKRKDNLKCHLKIHIPNRHRPFECDRCHRGYLRHVDLLRHIETVHLGVRRHFCRICNKGFTRKEGLRIHSERCF